MNDDLRHILETSGVSGRRRRDERLPSADGDDVWDTGTSGGLARASRLLTQPTAPLHRRESLLAQVFPSISTLMSSMLLQQSACE